MPSNTRRSASMITNGTTAATKNRTTTTSNNTNRSRAGGGRTSHQTTTKSNEDTVVMPTQVEEEERLSLASGSRGFLRVSEAVAVVRTDEEIGLSSSRIDATTGMLLNMKNMTDKEIGLTYRDVRVEEQVKQYCKTKLFHWLKFIATSSELSKLTEAHDIGNVVMKGLNINDEAMKPRWWLLYQEVVKKALDTQRSNCNMSIKSVMVESMRQDTMPKLQDILGGRKLTMTAGEDGEQTEFCKRPYFFFCNTVLECVAGKKTWKIQKKMKRISNSCVTVSDEAFALLLLVNSWEKFEYIADNPQCETRGELPYTKFTEKKGRNKKMRGWSHEGINNFNQLCAFVVKDRESDHGKQFEIDFLKYQKDELLRTKAGIIGGSDDDAMEQTEDMDIGPPNPAYNQLKDMCLEVGSDNKDDEEEECDVFGQVGQTGVV